jgi:ribonuclease BN (tRNA processing enzyme)
MIYDATYTDEEYNSERSSKVGWGHSTWQEAVKVAKAANVGKLIIFHHDPLHNDEFMDRIKENTAKQFPNSEVAWEGLEIDLLTSSRLPALEPTNEIKVSA